MVRVRGVGNEDDSESDPPSKRSGLLHKVLERADDNMSGAESQSMISP